MSAGGVWHSARFSVVGGEVGGEAGGEFVGI